MENITLTINDLATLRNVVDLASTRGAFRANELADVGAVYNKLSQFVEASVAADKAQQEAQAHNDSDNNQQSDTAKGD